ncbi:MAG: proline dehydrogenase family protein [Candidatus Micrarchaeia archaeon]
MMHGFAERLFAGRWIAGPDISDAIERAKRFNMRNISAILNYLGESLTDEESVESAVDMHFKLIDAVKRSRIDASISIKPTGLGLSIGYDVFESNYLRILERASRAGLFVWMDMEEPRFIGSEIKAYLGSIGSYKQIGICIQANMKRSLSDVKRIVARGGVIRLVKGAYSAPACASYASREQVDNNFIKLMRYMFMHAKEFTVATHDARLIELARRMNRKSEKEVTYAMLNGIRNELVVELAQTERVAVYVPFGTEWIPYSYRRLREAGHLSIILKSLMEKQGI